MVNKLKKAGFDRLFLFIIISIQLYYTIFTTFVALKTRSKLVLY